VVQEVLQHQEGQFHYHKWQDKGIIIKTNKKTYRKMNASGNDHDRETWDDLLQIIAKEFGKKGIYE